VGWTAEDPTGVGEAISSWRGFGEQLVNRKTLKTQILRNILFVTFNSSNL